MRRQANQYDKIFKENIEAVIPSLTKNILGITAVSSEELPDDIQHTKERKPDVLKKITDLQGNIFVFQIEFQLLDESDMVFRMAEYYIMLVRKYRLPIRQYVLFLGATIPKMPLTYESDLLNYHFPLISFSQLDYCVFLQSTQPEEVVLAILANFRGESPEDALRKIVYRVEETTRGDFSLRRYFSQLRVLAQLRNLEHKLKDLVMDNIAKYVSEERDVAYMIAREKEQTNFVTNLLQKSDFSLEKIIEIAGVSAEFVKNIQQKLTAKK